MPRYALKSSRGRLSPLRYKGIYTPLYRRDNGCVARWHLDEESGTRFDSSGNGLHLTSVNNVVAETGIVRNAAILSAASSQRLTRANTAMLMPTVRFTIAAWINATSLGSTRAIVAKTDTVTNGYQLVHNGSGAIELWVCNGSGTAMFTGGADIIAAGSWAHVAASYDGGQSPRVRIFINGTSRSLSGSVPASAASNSAVFSVGARSNGTQYFTGLIDSLALWNRALTPSEIFEDYQLGLKGLYV